MKDFIDELKLSKHPEGGFYRRSFTSSVKVRPQDQPALYAAFTHIYFYLPKGGYSRFHQNRYDEVWNLYSGEGIRIFLKFGFLEIVLFSKLKLQKVNKLYKLFF